MKRNPGLFLEDILNGISSIEEFMGTIEFQQFLVDEKTKRAVVHTLEIIGEAAKNLPRDLKQKHRDIPWADMARMHDKLSHFYFGINYEIVWKVVKDDLPKIKPRIQQILQNIQRKMSN